MKKLTIYLFLITGILTAGATSHAQENRFDSIVDFGFPKAVKYLDSQKRRAFDKEKPNLRVITTPTKLNKSNTYRLDNILIKANAGLNHEFITNKEKTSDCWVEEWKRFLSVLGRLEPQEIRQINTGKILIVHGYEVKEVKRYLIAGDNLTCDKMFTIAIDYEKKDADKAKQLVEHLLKHIKFK